MLHILRHLGMVLLFFFSFMAAFSHRKSENKPPEMTLERAVNLLTQDNEDTLICAASHIQNQCFRSDDAKKIVCLFVCIVKDYCR